MEKIQTDQKGFTLIELIMVIVIIGILSAVISPLIANKFLVVNQSVLRASWVQQAEFALFHLRTDLAKSIPYSVCTTTNSRCDAGQTIEFLGINDKKQTFKARYRDKPRADYDHLTVNNDSSFDLLGYFDSLPPYLSIGITSAAQARSSWQRAQTTSNTTHIARITRSNSLLTEDDNNANTNPDPSITNITLTNRAHNFLSHSPTFHAYFTDGPISYRCENGTLYRISNYTNFNPSTLYSVRTASALVERITTNVTNCLFILRANELEVQLSIGVEPETITLTDVITLGQAL